MSESGTGTGRLVYEEGRSLSIPRQTLSQRCFVIVPYLQFRRLLVIPLRSREHQQPNSLDRHGSIQRGQELV